MWNQLLDLSFQKHHRRAASEALVLGPGRDDSGTCHFCFFLVPTSGNLVWHCLVELRRKTLGNRDEIDHSPRVGPSTTETA